MIWVCVLLAVSTFIGYVTRPAIGGWYSEIVRSDLTPPSYVFGIAWTILYCFIGAAGWLLWQQANVTVLKTLFLVQIILNWLWSPLFFLMHLAGWSLIVIVLLIVLVGVLIYKGYSTSRFFVLLMAPYWLWLLFALYLNAYIYHYN